MIVGGSNRGPLGGARRGSTSPSSLLSQPLFSGFLDWIFYNFDVTKILIIVVSRGGGEKVLVAILCITIVPVVIHVPSHRGCCHSSLSGP